MMKICTTAITMLAISCSSSSEKASPAPSPAAVITPVTTDPTCGKPASQADPLVVLFTPGNRWRYLEQSSWHDTLREQATVEEHVEKIHVTGPYVVAVLSTDVTRKGAPPERAITHRVRQGNKVWRTECLSSPTDVQAIAEAIRSCGAVESEGATPERMVACGQLTCAVSVAHVHGTTSFLPGVGILATHDASYSAETGDGGAIQRSLSGYELVHAPPPVTLADEPADAARARTAIHAAAAAGSPDALAPLLDENVQFSLNLEHLSAKGALASWKADGGHALRKLAEVTASPCGLVKDGPSELVLCPATFAKARAAGTCRSSAPQTARAVLERKGDAWRLRALLLGGEDDVFSMPESASGPPLPMSLQQRFNSKP